MARKPNYSFERNSRSKAKAAKREAKREAKLAAKADKQTAEPGGDQDDEPSEQAEAAKHDSG